MKLIDIFCHVSKYVGALEIKTKSDTVVINNNTIIKSITLESINNIVDSQI